MKFSGLVDISVEMISLTFCFAVAQETLLSQPRPAGVFVRDVARSNKVGWTISVERGEGHPLPVGGRVWG